MSCVHVCVCACVCVCPHRKNELEELMLLNLSKKAWTAGLVLNNFETHQEQNEKIVKELKTLADRYDQVRVCVRARVCVCARAPCVCARMCACVATPCVWPPPVAWAWWLCIRGMGVGLRQRPTYVCVCMRVYT